MRIKKILSLQENDSIEIDLKNTDTTADDIGDVVVIDPADLTGRSAKKTVTAGNSLVIGIRKSKVAVGEVGSVYILGAGIPAKVKTGATDTIAIGDVLATSTTAGCLSKGTTGGFAVAMESVDVNLQKIIKVKIL